MGKHTPGPWTWNEDRPENYDLCWLRGSDGTNIFTLYGNGEITPNKALIAAAPDLLHELTNLIAANERARAAEDNWIRSGNDEATGMEFEDAVASVIICEHSARITITKATQS